MPTKPMMFAATALAACLCANPAAAQQEGGSGAEQVVGLFGATCLHFTTDVAGLRAFMQQQNAPLLPDGPRDAFLAGRKGVVFDTSFQTVKLALVSIDDGTCEAVVDQADPRQVVTTLQQAAQENGVQLSPLGNEADRNRKGVSQLAFGFNPGGKPMHVLVSTATAIPQAVLTLIPR